MLELSKQRFSAEFASAKNLEPRIHAYVAEAFRLDAQAVRMTLEAGDTIRPAQGKAIDQKRRHALSMYAQALDMQAQHEASLTRFQKIKPHLMNAIIITVVAAEILSIPILLANIYMMCKKCPRRDDLSSSC